MNREEFIKALEEFYNQAGYWAKPSLDGRLEIVPVHGTLKLHTLKYVDTDILPEDIDFVFKK